MNSNVTNSVNIQNIPVKKVHVGDIDIAYKTFGKGEPILLIAGAGMTMDNWPPSVLNQLALNHTVVIFDNRGGCECYDLKARSIRSGNRIIDIRSGIGDLDFRSVSTFLYGNSQT